MLLSQLSPPSVFGVLCLACRPQTDRRRPRLAAAAYGWPRIWPAPARRSDFWWSSPTSGPTPCPSRERQALRPCGRAPTAHPCSPRSRGKIDTPSRPGPRGPAAPAPACAPKHLLKH